MINGRGHAHDETARVPAGIPALGDFRERHEHAVDGDAFLCGLAFHEYVGGFADFERNDEAREHVEHLAKRANMGVHGTELFAVRDFELQQRGAELHDPRGVAVTQVFEESELLAGRREFFVQWGSGEDGSPITIPFGRLSAAGLIFGCLCFFLLITTFL
jgi:hypothetical protein